MKIHKVLIITTLLILAAMIAIIRTGNWSIQDSKPFTAIDGQSLCLQVAELAKSVNSSVKIRCDYVKNRR